MPCLLPADCLNEVFEYLEKDTATLHSCLLVNRLWCEVSVGILWRDIWNFRSYGSRLRAVPSILSTLIACLPNESKELLHENKIFISTPTSKPPIFNYAAFCKVLSINEIVQIIDDVLRNEQHDFTSHSLNDKNCLVTKEILKMFMDQISTLKKLTYCLSGTLYNMSIQDDISFIHLLDLLGARNCLADLSELHCNSIIQPDFFYQLSQMCHSIQSLTIEINNGSDFSNELKELISLQSNLKNLNLLAYCRNGSSWAGIIPSLTIHRNTLKRLQLYCDDDTLPLSFVSLFSNLQEINFSFTEDIFEYYPESFRELQHVSFPKLQTLKLPGQCPKPEYVIKFLEINGENLKELYMNSDLSLHIANFCPNLKRLFVLFRNGKLDELKTIFNSCQQLESIEIWCGKGFLSEREVLEVVANHSSKNFYELKIYNNTDSILLPDDLESFFISWKNRIPKKLFSLIIIRDYYSCYRSLEENEDNVKIIETYINLGVIKKFTKGNYIQDVKSYIFFHPGN